MRRYEGLVVCVCGRCWCFWGRGRALAAASAGLGHQLGRAASIATAWAPAVAVVVHGRCHRRSPCVRVIVGACIVLRRARACNAWNHHHARRQRLRRSVAVLPSINRAGVRVHGGHRHRHWQRRRRPPPFQGGGAHSRAAASLTRGEGTATRVKEADDGGRWMMDANGGPL